LQLTVKMDPAKQREDHIIAYKVQSALLYHRSVSGTKTKVSVKDGIVTLSGDASSEAQKDLTEEYAKDIDGVKGVLNTMKVSPGTPTRTFNEIMDDASITAQVKSALLTHRSTSSLKTKVTTKDGVVTLTGEAKNPAELTLVTKLANDINGVKAVVNNMSAPAE
jgi:hyperosmotically inducible periplasmic protein